MSSGRLRHTRRLLVTAGQNIERLRSDGASAALCGQPHPGLLRTHQPPPRLRRHYEPTALSTVARRAAEGKAKNDTTRRLQVRQRARIYPALRDDLRSLTPS